MKIDIRTAALIAFALAAAAVAVTVDTVMGALAAFDDDNWQEEL